MLTLISLYTKRETHPLSLLKGDAPTFVAKRRHAPCNALLTLLT
jgi:hypothetical protein